MMIIETTKTETKKMKKIPVPSIHRQYTETQKRMRRTQKRKRRGDSKSKHKLSFTLGVG